MKKVSLYEELFGEIDGPVEKLEDGASDSKVSIANIKYDTKIPNLEKMCYLMESVVLQKKREGTIYAGFQKISRAEAIWDRYLKMAENVDKIYIYGEKDKSLTPHPKIEIVPLPKGHPLIREWFLVMDIKFGKNMMTAYDLDGFGTYENEKDRNFRGGKTINKDIVEKAVRILEDGMK